MGKYLVAVSLVKYPGCRSFLCSGLVVICGLNFLYSLNQKDINEFVIEAAFPLWTFVHGLSFLVIDGNVSVNRMPINIDDQTDKATSRLMPAEVQ